MSTGQTPASSVVLTEDQVSIMTADSSGNVYIFTPSAAVYFTVPCGSLSVAVSFINQLKNFLGSQTNSPVFTPYVGVSTLVWSSISPSSFSISSKGNQYAYSVTGTGFVVLNPSSFQFTEGGLTFLSAGVTVVNDTTLLISLPSGLSAVAGYPVAYGVSYATRTSGGYISTGLTVTVSP